MCPAALRQKRRVPARAGQLVDRPPAHQPHEPPVPGKADGGRNGRADKQADGEERDPVPTRSRNRLPRRLTKKKAESQTRPDSDRLRHAVQQNAQGQLDAPEPCGALGPARRLDRRRNKAIEEARTAAAWGPSVEWYRGVSAHGRMIPDAPSPLHGAGTRKRSGAGPTPPKTGSRRFGAVRHRQSPTAKGRAQALPRVARSSSASRGSRNRTSIAASTAAPARCDPDAA